MDKIVKIEKLSQINDYVYDLEVEDSHSFLANDIIVHNTDSIFISTTNDITVENFVLQMQELEKQINILFKEFMKKFTKNECVINSHKIKIEMEKTFSPLLLTDVKKRYFGLRTYYKGQITEGKLSVTGFETRRDDTPEFFKKALSTVYEIILLNDDKKMSEFIKECKKEIKNTHIENLVIKVKLSKKLEEYKNIPIHLRALQNSGLSINRGETVNMLYVKKQGVTHYDENSKINYDIDYNMYIEKFLKNKLQLIVGNKYDNLFNNSMNLMEWIK